MDPLHLSGVRAKAKSQLSKKRYLDSLMKSDLARKQAAPYSVSTIQDSLDHGWGQG